MWKAENPCSNKYTKTRGTKPERDGNSAFSRPMSESFGLKHPGLLYFHKRENAYPAATLGISLTLPFSSGMSSFLTSINSNLTFALRLSWNTTPRTGPLSIFHSLEHLKQLLERAGQCLYSIMSFTALPNKCYFSFSPQSKVFLTHTVTVLTTFEVIHL